MPQGVEGSNGAPEIAPGSHREGAVPAADAASKAETYPSEICTAERGDVLVLAMLTLHRSRPAPTPSQRRTLRIGFSAGALPPPLQWAL